MPVELQPVAAMTKTNNSFIILLGILTLYSWPSFGQDDPWASWNEKYKEVDIALILDREQTYADSVRENPDAVQFYARQDGYRFMGTFTGEWRKLSEERRKIMKRTFKIFSGQHVVFDQLRNEVQIAVENDTIWMPIQPTLEKPFKKEVKKGENVYLYALYFNYHTSDQKLYNIFFISEFNSEYP